MSGAGDKGSDGKNWGKLQGRTLLDSSEHSILLINSQGFSFTGTQTLRLTSHPAVYVHDTGGLLGEETVARLERVSREKLRLEIVLTDDEPRVAIEASFPGNKKLAGVSTKRLSAKVAEELWQLGAALVPEAKPGDLVTPLALPMTLRFDGGKSDDIAAHLSAGSGRLFAIPLDRKRPKIDWPLGRVAVSGSEKDALTIRGGAVAGNRMVEEATVRFPSGALRDGFLDAVRKLAGNDVTGSALSVGVKVVGGRFGDGVFVDAVLTDDALEFCSRDGAEILASAPFADPEFRIAGVPERFVIYASGLGPVAVNVDRRAQTFAKRLLALPAVVAAAERGTADGPFPTLLVAPGEKDASPVLARLGPGELSVAGQAAERCFPLSAVRSVEPSFEDGQSTLKVEFDAATPPLVLAAPARVLEALHTAIRAESLAGAGPERTNDLLRAAAGLEEDYFLHEVFGPCYELHAALVSKDWAKSGSADLSRPVAIPTGDPQAKQAERDRIAGLFVAGLEELRRHFDRVAHVLPPLLSAWDAELATGAGAPRPAWRKVQEAELRRGLAVAARAGAEVQQLSVLAARGSDFNPDTAEADYSSALITLGAGVLFNPIFLVSAASQAFSQDSAVATRKAGMTKQALGALRSLAARWNDFITELVPMLGYTLTESLFRARIETARSIAEDIARGDADAQVAGLRRVARRAARLDVRRRYPALPIEPASGASSDRPITRCDIVGHIKGLRSKLATDRFARV